MFIHKIKKLNLIFLDVLINNVNYVIILLNSEQTFQLKIICGR